MLVEVVGLNHLVKQLRGWINATPLGLRMSFVGANREVARLAGVRVDRIRLGSYVASGLISGLAA